VTATHTDLPVAVIGAGPIGLAAAAELVLRDQAVVVLEAGAQAGAAVRSWGHVRLFSPWSEVVSPAGAALLEPTGWQHPPAEAYPTGREWADHYLQPLAEALGDRVRTGQRVVGVARRHRDLLVTSGRAEQPFVLHVRDETGRASRLLARAVIDASGTLARPNPLGAEGYPAYGEERQADVVRYGIPDAGAEEDRGRYAGRATAVVGSGASALTALLSLTSEPLCAPGSRVVWVLRRGGVGDTFGGGEADELPTRGALGLRARQAVEDGLVEVVTGFRVVGVEGGPGDRVRLVGADGRVVEGLDEVVAVTGFRPDLSFLSEVALDLDSRLQAPTALAPDIDPNHHSCGTVRPHGHRVLAQPETGLYLAGMKSYGRAPSFLAMTGHEQVRSVAAALAGDLESADRVELTLPETGVCHGAGLFDEAADAAGDAAGGCCGPVTRAPELLTLTVPPSREKEPVR
jgi:thioredoxin reductase